MPFAKVSSLGEYVGRLPYDCECVRELTTFAEKHNIKSAVFNLIGAAKSAKLAYYDQKAKKYREFEVNEETEVVSCTGNISWKDGRPFVHAHASLAKEDGTTVGGHLRGMRVFAVEVYLRRFKDPIERIPDEVTGLNLMNFEKNPEHDIKDVSDVKRNRQA